MSAGGELSVEQIRTAGTGLYRDRDDLVLEVDARGNKRWVHEWCDPEGARKRIVMGEARATAHSLEWAREYVQKVEAMVERSRQLAEVQGGCDIRSEVAQAQEMLEALQREEAALTRRVSELATHHRQLCADIEEARRTASTKTCVPAMLSGLLKYPKVPPAGIAVADVDHLPEKLCGVYFLWRNGAVAYVGHSINIRGRLRSHPLVTSDTTISYLNFRAGELVFAECFYVALTEAPLNRARPHETYGAARRAELVSFATSKDEGAA